MTQPKTNMVDPLVELIDTEWNDADVPRRNLRIEKSDDLGKGRDVGTYDYVEASNTSPLGLEYADLFMNHQNVDVVVFLEIKASTEARRDQLFDEVRRIVEANRKRPDTPGGHDRMMFQDITPLDDDTFGAYVHEVVVAFESRSRNVGAPDFTPEPDDDVETVDTQPSTASTASVHTWSIDDPDFGKPGSGGDEVDEITVSYDSASFDGLDDDDITVVMRRTLSGGKSIDQIGVNSDDYSGSTATFRLSGINQSDAAGLVRVIIDGVKNPAGSEFATITLSGDAPDYTEEHFVKIG